MSDTSIENALELLFEGFEDLQGEIEEQILGRVVEEGDSGPPPTEEQLEQLDEQFLTRVQTSLGKLVERDVCEPADFIAMISIIGGAVEEMAPELFEDDDDDDEPTAL